MQNNKIYFKDFIDMKKYSDTQSVKCRVIPVYFDEIDIGINAPLIWHTSEDILATNITKII